MNTCRVEDFHRQFSVGSALAYGLTETGAPLETQDCQLESVTENCKVDKTGIFPSLLEYAEDTSRYSQD